ncbi:hypothetical protein L1049_004007 [Liquidambar formosana]|uniref:Major pollen allergen Ole e 6-like n=1 Tax=Liquidambar formosana TaxID=63359 RepID=A0AAP0RMR4_LIQFO
MTNKMVAVFFMCTIVLAAVHVGEAVAKEEFKSCYNNCHGECKAGGNGGTLCEMKCDNDCTAKETAGQVKGLQQEYMGK